MSIQWSSTNINPPDAGREIIAKNPLKPDSYRSASKQCKTMKFNPAFTQSQMDDAVADMIEEGFSLWSYTE